MLVSVKCPECNAYLDDVDVNLEWEEGYHTIEEDITCDCGCVFTTSISVDISIDIDVGDPVVIDHGLEFKGKTTEGYNGSEDKYSMSLFPEMTL